LNLSANLKATARGLLGWSEKKVGHVASQLELAKELLHQLDMAQDSRMLMANEAWLRRNHKKHSLALASLSRTIARLRSRIGWIKDGDANTALFHVSARYRKGKNFIASVTAREGQILTTHEDKAAEFEDFCNGLLDSHESREVTIDLDALGVLSYELAQLEAPFSRRKYGTQSSASLPTKRPGWMASLDGSIRLADPSSRTILWRQSRVFGPVNSEI
jgi:hypothetical protein